MRLMVLGEQTAHKIGPAVWSKGVLTKLMGNQGPTHTSAYFWDAQEATVTCRCPDWKA